MPDFPHLFQPFQLGSAQLRNRLFNPAHGTTLGKDGKVTDELIAYHTTRAEGGVGLIILESMTLHPTYGFPEAFLYAGSDEIIPGLERLGRECRARGVPVFGQLFHAGRAVRLSHDGSRPQVWSASAVPDERYRMVPAPMPNALIWELIDAYVSAAQRFAEAGLDGVEILAGMGYLIAQFLNPHTNRREDEFGGSFENRLRLLREIVTRTREAIGPSLTLGIRVSLDEKVDRALPPEDLIRACQVLDADGHLDYFNVIAGSSASPDGWMHVFPPMAMPTGYVAPDAARLKAAVSKPVLVAGRINQPHTAEAILASGQADMVGMVRALIADPEFPNKARTGRAEDIRACIGCNQACVGHRLAHHAISCIQHPVTGRERTLREPRPAQAPKRVMVVGGGPAGMKAAVVAAQRGHEVTLYEQSRQLGGQVLLAQQLPGRAEFGGSVTNLLRELELCRVRVEKGVTVTPEFVQSEVPEAVILATGARSCLPEAEIEGATVVEHWDVISGKAEVGDRVVIADWACDWGGLGVAEQLARDGCRVRLLSGGVVAGEQLQGIVRDQWLGILHKLGVEMIPFARFFGADSTTAYFQHMTSGEPIVCEDVDTVVTCYARQAENALAASLQDFSGSLIVIGDAVAPRTVEEAVLEGFRAAWEL